MSTLRDKLGGVYMGKLAPARVSYRDDFVISYHVYMMTGFFLDWQKLRMRYPFQSTCKPISHRNEWSFRVYMIPPRGREGEDPGNEVDTIPLRNLVPEWNSRPGERTGVNSRRGDSRRHDILWWYHVNKCRAMRWNRSEVAPVSCKHGPRRFTPTKC